MFYTKEGAFCIGDFAAPLPQQSRWWVVAKICLGACCVAPFLVGLCLSPANVLTRRVVDCCTLSHGQVSGWKGGLAVARAAGKPLGVCLGPWTFPCFPPGARGSLPPALWPVQFQGCPQGRHAQAVAFLTCQVAYDRPWCMAKHVGCRADTAWHAVLGIM